MINIWNLCNNDDDDDEDDNDEHKIKIKKDEEEFNEVERVIGISS